MLLVELFVFVVVAGLAEVVGLAELLVVVGVLLVDVWLVGVWVCGAGGPIHTASKPVPNQ